MTHTLIELEQSAQDTYGSEAKPRMGFFTDTSICIGCKACEVACKEWNHVPEEIEGWTGHSYDHSIDLGANRWRHVAFIEQKKPLGADAAAESLVEAAERANAVEGWGLDTYQDGDGMRWLMASDVCKHCTSAACLDVCPTGALFRTEFGTVVVQEDVCNGCGYCVPACPFGVLDKREDDGRVWKCTLCYDRLKDDLEPACAKACPTQSIQYGELDELRARAEQRLAKMHEAGASEARLYGADDDDGVGGFGAFFLLLDEPEVYGLPPDPVVTTRDIGEVWAGALTAAVALGVGVAAAVFGGGAGERRAQDGRAGRAALVLRAAGHQGAGVDARDPVLLLHRRAGGSVGDPRGGGGGARQRRAGPARMAQRARRSGHQPGAPDLRPRPPGALPQHAPDVQGHLSDERRLLDPGRQRRDHNARRAERSHGPLPTRGARG